MLFLAFLEVIWDCQAQFPSTLALKRDLSLTALVLGAELEGDLPNTGPKWQMGCLLFPTALIHSPPGSVLPLSWVSLGLLTVPAAIVSGEGREEISTSSPAEAAAMAVDQSGAEPLHSR